MSTQIRGYVDIQIETIMNDQIAADAGIVYSKLDLASSIVDDDVVSLAWSKLTGTPTTLGGYGVTAPVEITGSSSDSSASSLIVRDSTTSNLLTIRNDGKVTWGTAEAPTSANIANGFYESGVEIVGSFHRNDPGEARICLAASGVEGPTTPGTYAYPTFFAQSTNRVRTLGIDTWTPMQNGAIIGAFCFRGCRNNSGNFNEQTGLGLVATATENWSDAANGIRFHIRAVKRGTLTQYNPFEVESDNGIIALGATSDSTTYAFQAKASTGAAFFVARNDGRIGIGTTAPADLAAAVGANKTMADGRGQVGVFSSNDMGINLGGQIVFGGVDTTGGVPVRSFAAIAGRKENSSSGNRRGYLQFGVRTSGDIVEFMRLDSNGQLAIGTTDPRSRIHVVGIPDFIDNAAALFGGLTPGAFYQTSGLLKVVI